MKTIHSPSFQNSCLWLLNRFNRSAFQAICVQFSLSQRAGPLASAASASLCVVHSWVRENHSVQNLFPLMGEGEFSFCRSRGDEALTNTSRMALLFPLVHDAPHRLHRGQGVLENRDGESVFGPVRSNLACKNPMEGKYFKFAATQGYRHAVFNFFGK